MNFFTIRLQRIEYAKTISISEEELLIDSSNYNVWWEALLEILGGYGYTFVPEFLETGKIPNGSNFSESEMIEIEAATVLAAEAVISGTVSPVIRGRLMSSRLSGRDAFEYIRVTYGTRSLADLVQSLSDIVTILDSTGLTNVEHEEYQILVTRLRGLSTCQIFGVLEIVCFPPAVRQKIIQKMIDSKVTVANLSLYSAHQACEAHLSATSSTSEQASVPSWKKSTCQWCDIPGHVAKECRRLKSVLGS